MNIKQPKKEQNHMETNTRQKEIMERLYKSGKVYVGELSRSLYVSEMTVRRDLAEMEKNGLLKRFRGGAVLKFNQGELPISERVLIHKSEKEELAALGARHLTDGITVFIDSSSTCQYMLPYLKNFKDIKIITNSAKTMLTAGNLHIPCFLIGGEYYAQDMCLVGALAEDYARMLNVDVAFFTTAGYSEEDGVISDFDARQTAIRREIMKNAKKKVFLFEKRKLGKKFLYTLARREDVSEIITLKD